MKAAGFSFDSAGITALISDAKAKAAAEDLNKKLTAELADNAKALESAKTELTAATAAKDDAEKVSAAAKQEAADAKASAEAAIKQATDDVAKAQADADKKASIKGAEIVGGMGFKGTLPNDAEANGAKGASASLYEEYNRLLAKDPKAATAFFRANKDKMFS